MFSDSLLQCWLMLLTMIQDSHAVAQKLKLVQAKVACCQRISAEPSKGNSSLVGHARVSCWKGPVCIPAQCITTI